MSKGTPEDREPAKSGYALVNGLNMYYEIHGAGEPLVLLHGAFMSINGFGAILPALAERRQVIALEQQAHGRTGDIDRPLTFEQMADDTAELLRQLNITRADLFGYSMGGAVALQVAISHPDLVRKLVVASVYYNNDGTYPELLEAERGMKPEDFTGSMMEAEYKRLAPNKDDWPALVGKIIELDLDFEGFSAADIRSIKAPTLLMLGDSDIVRPEQAVEMFRLLGGGVPGDLAGLPQSRLAILPGTTHVTMMAREDWLVPMINEFLDGVSPKPSL